MSAQKRQDGPAGFQPEAIEQEVLRQWNAESTFGKSLEQRKDAKHYSFYDGPPYATGSPHYGHILQTAIKDTVTRYWTMRGFFVPRRVGWDCHGLPVENLVEKELGIKHKKEIEERGIEVFNAACRHMVFRHVDEWTQLLRRVGRWADYQQAYATMETPFMESAWWVFKTAWDRGLVYRGLRSSPYCPRCETPLSNFETTLGYEEVTDPSVIVKVPLADEQSTCLLVWTTTPWTLPANVAIAVHPDLRYVRARVGSETWIVAKDRVAEVLPESHSVEDEFAGSALVGKIYQPLYQFVELTAPAYRVVAATFVSGTEGTGLVHIAPAFGEEDFRLAQEEHLPLLHTVDGKGRFLPAVTPWAEQFVKDADADIIKDLEARGALVRADTIRHDYPHCWRCSTPLIYMAVDSWFIAVTKIKEQLVQNAEQIHWVPVHLKEGRFGQGLRDAPDWAISRTRYWGIPLPVWQCSACEQYTVVGSVRELEQLGGNLAGLKSPHADTDLHRPYVDRVVLKCQHCGGEAKRVSEVLDVWFDSGSMPYGQWHYPFENKELVESTFPADFIGEALDQTRGWFYTLHVLAGVLTLDGLKNLGLGIGKPAYKNVVASGLVLAEDGRKLSKRFGNYPEPDGIVSKYGADTLRLYLLSSAKTGEDYRFSDQLVGDLYRRFTLILWNVWQYYRTYGAEISSSKFQIPNRLELPVLDRWILARTAQLAADVQSAMDAYQLDDASRALIPFVEDLSTWYVRRSRGREEALPVLREVLRQFSLIAAPFIPFLAEHIHRGLAGASPHLADFPTSEVGKLQTSEVELLEQMRVLREIASAGQRLRAEAKIKVRQPLAEVVLVGTFPALEAAGEEGLALLHDELNVKDIRIVSQVSSLKSHDSWVWVEVPGGKLGLNTELTPELRQEGMIRDLIRQVQELRKQAGCRFDERIVLNLDTESPDTREAVEKLKPLLQEETKSTAVQFEHGTADAQGTVRIGDASVWVGVKRQLE